MKNFLLLLSLTVFFVSASYGQTSNDSIAIIKSGGGTVFVQNGEQLNVNQLLNRMKPKPEAYKLMQKAQNTYTLGTVLSVAGGALVGFPIGTMLGGGDPEWGMAGAGAVLIVISVPLISKFKREVKIAVDAFNRDIQQTTSFWGQTELRLAFSGNGVGLTLSF